MVADARRGPDRAAGPLQWRADEAVTAQIDWIDRRPTVPVLNVLGKGDQQRAVPMSHHVVEAVDRLMRGLAERAGVAFPKGAATHSLRHHYGMTLALSGVHPSLLSQLMGHEDPQASEIYTRVVSRSAHRGREALDRAGLL